MRRQVLSNGQQFTGGAAGRRKELQPATLTEAQRRAQELGADLTARGTHADVLRFCREVLLADNYFHAVLEAVNSVAENIRQLTGLTDAEIL